MPSVFRRHEITRSGIHSYHVFYYSMDTLPDHPLYCYKKLFVNNGKALCFEAKDSGGGVTPGYPPAVNIPLYNIDDKWRKLALRFGVMSNPDRIAAKGLNAMFKHRRKCIPSVLTKNRSRFD